MGKRKGRKEAQETQILADELGENGEEEGAKGAGFFACYLLTSLCPRFKGHSYIGYTLNPRRRIRQHNGEIGSGAWRTKRKRPWEMVLCIYGFPTNIAALQFEWAWQHPVESLAVRNAATSFKSLSGLANKIKMAYTMLTLPAWQSLNLTVNLFSTKYQKYTAACPALPEQMRTQVSSMDDLPCYNEDACVNDDEWDNNEFECSFQYPKEKESTGEIHNSPSHGVNYDEWDNNEFECSFQHPKEKESTGATREMHDSPNHDGGGLQVKSPLNREEDQGQSFSMNNSPAKTSFSFGSSYVFEDLQSPRLVELSRVFDKAVDRRSTTAFVADEALDGQLPTALVGNEDQTLTRSGEVEIIDIVTPSPCHRINSGSKKRRRPTLVPEIIDLTNSPMYV